MTFKEYFLKESSDEVTKITDPNGSYKLKYTDGAVMRFKLGEDKSYPVTFVYTDKHGFAHSPDNDTPAITYNDIAENAITQGWYRNGVQHREGDKPAEITKKASTGAIEKLFYLKNGEKHRLTGPAVITYYNGIIYIEDYFIHGKKYTKEEFDEYTKGLESKEDKELLGDLGQTFD